MNEMWISDTPFFYWPGWRARWSLWSDQRAVTSSPPLIKHCGWKETTRKTIEKKKRGKSERKEWNQLNKAKRIWKQKMLFRLVDQTHPNFFVQINVSNIYFKHLTSQQFISLRSFFSSAPIGGPPMTLKCIVDLKKKHVSSKRKGNYIFNTSSNCWSTRALPYTAFLQDQKLSHWIILHLPFCHINLHFYRKL